VAGDKPNPQITQFQQDAITNYLAMGKPLRQNYFVIDGFGVNLVLNKV